MRPVYANEVYQERDTRFVRYVRVRSVANGVVIISRCDENGVLENSMRVTKAKQERFNGASGGYMYKFSLATANPQGDSK